MPQLNEMMNESSVASLPSVSQTSSTGEVVLPSTPTPMTPIPTQRETSNETTVSQFIDCQTSASLMVFNQNETQILNNLISQNAYKSSNSGLSAAQTQLTFSDLTPPVPNVSTLESDRLLTVDTSLPTVDGVSGAVPEPKSMLIQQMSSMASEPPSIEIPVTEQLLAPKEVPSIMEVTQNQYSNIFQPVINGPSGSAPQTPAASPIASIETSVTSSATMNSTSETTELQTLPTFDSNGTTFANNNNVSNDVFNVPINQMVADLSETNVSSVTSDGPLPVLGVEPALQEQLLDAIPPPRSNFPPGPSTDESGIPTALPGEFPLSLLPVEEEKVGDVGSISETVPLDKIEATINMNANSVPTLTDAVSLTQPEVNLIKSLPQTPQLISVLQTSDIMTANHIEGSAQQHFNLNYSCQSMGSELVMTNVEQMGAQSQTSTAAQLSQPSPQPQQASQTSCLTTLSEAQLPPPPAPPSASIAVFQSTQNELIPEMVKNQLTTILPPPPPLQPVQNVSQSNIAPLQEMNTLTNLVPVVETPTPMSGCGPISVVVKTEPQTYNESIAAESDKNLLMSKVNDDNNNPILSNSLRHEKETNTRNCLTSPSAVINNSVRGFPLCVISTAPTSFMSKNNVTITPKYELTLPPKKAKYGTGLTTVTQSLSSVSSKVSSQAVPSTGMIYDLPQHSESSSTNSPPFRVQSGIQQTSKLQHNISPPFTSVAPILFSGLVPSVSVAIDGPLSLVKEDKMRQLMTSTSISNHPDYPAISGLLSFIKPEFAYHTKSLTTSSLTNPSEVVSEVPLSLSIKNSMSQTPITSLALNQLTSGPVPSSLSRPQLHHNQQNITCATTVLHTPPTAVPVSVVTSVVEHHRGLTHRIKSIGQNGNRSKQNEDHNSVGSLTTGSKLQLAPLLSGDPAKPFQCALCGKHLASKNVYQLHLRSHSGEKPFSCNLCGHSFSQKTSLTRHMRSHTGERPFPCQVCGKRFADKERIKIHMRTHTGEKPFACDICGKQFSQKSTVKRHMSVHTGEKPFKCETCGKGFANRGNLTAHTKTHSNS